MSAPTLRPPASLARVYLYRDPVDFRKSYRGLSVLVEQEIGHSPFSGDLYVFVNRDRSRIKMLFWERNGFVLYYKALADLITPLTQPSLEKLYCHIYQQVANKNNLG